MGLQTPSAPQFLPLAPSLGTLCSVQWVAMSIHFCIYQHWHSLSRDNYIRLLSTRTCYHPQYYLSLVTVFGMDPQVGQSETSILLTLLLLHPLPRNSFFLHFHWKKILLTLNKSCHLGIIHASSVCEEHLLSVSIGYY